MWTEEEKTYKDAEKVQIKITQKDMDNPQAKPIDEVAEKYARSVKEDFKLDECTYGLVYRAFLTGVMYERTNKQ